MSRGDRKEQILRAAERVIRNRRYHEIKLDEIAREAGVGKGTIYLYFKGKDDLFIQLVAEGFDTLCEVMRQSIESAQPFQEKLGTMAAALSSFMEKRHAMMRVVLEEERRRSGGRAVQGHGGWFAEHRARLDAAQARLMEQGVAEGVLREDISPLALARLLMGLIHSQHMLAKCAGVTTPIKQIVDLFFNGARRHD